MGEDKPTSQNYVEDSFGYDLSTPIDELRATYEFDISCQGSVPQSIVAFLEASGYEDAVRNAISLGGDADTMATIAGGIAQAYWGVPADIESRTRTYLDPELLAVLDQFERQAGTREQI